MWPALIAAGASLIGSKLASDSAEKQSDIQREFAQSGIQWKVADAKAAGVHPLFALGASTSSYSPVVSQAPQMIADAGQNISRAAMASQQADAQAEVQAAQIRASDASAMKDLAQSQYYASLAARSQQETQTSMPAAVPMPVYRSYGGDSLELQGFRQPIEGQSVGRAVGSAAPRSASVSPTGAVRYEADKVISSSPADASVTAGVRPGWMRVVIGEVEGIEGREPLEIVLPQGSEVSDALEAISEGGGSGIRGMIYAENLRRYGSGYAHALRNRLRRGGSGSIGADLVAPVGDFFREWRRRKEANRPGR